MRMLSPNITASDGTSSMAGIHSPPPSRLPPSPADHAENHSARDSTVNNGVRHNRSHQPYEGTYGVGQRRSLMPPPVRLSSYHYHGHDDDEYGYDGDTDSKRANDFAGGAYCSGSSERE